MELKYMKDIEKSLGIKSSNRTFMELKSDKVRSIIRMFRRSNRTFMELKLL